MNIYTELDVEGYERVVRCDNEDVGFVAWIAVHNTALGPALGGCRVWKYESEDAALTDVLRLSKGMTYKNSLARLPLGGGKSVVDADLNEVDRIALFREIGNFVELFDGLYITAEDMNSTVEDMAVIKSRTGHVATVGASGNPSPFTALGVYHAICASVKHLMRRDSLNGLTVAIQGVGETGGRLAEMLYTAGCSLIVADVNADNIRALQENVPFIEVVPGQIYDADCDIFSPCAMGGILNSETIPRLKCRIVAGSANNQLLEESDGARLLKRNIVYAPDYVVNAGGVMNICCEIGQVYDAEKARALTLQIGENLKEVLKTAELKKLPTNIIANRLAEKYVAAGRYPLQDVV
ncbi:Glu/Leu/Phe/Val family dehydrogenase [Desulforhopalus sp. 52FAK]